MEKWEWKTTPGSDHELCTIYEVGRRAVARHVTPENAKYICDEHNAHAALLAACKAAYADCVDDFYTRSPLAQQLKAAIDLAQPPSDVAAEKGGGT